MVAVVALVAAGCSDGSGGAISLPTQPTSAPTNAPPDSVGESTTVAPSAVKDWTVMVYMASGNDLEPDAVDDVKEMQAGVTDDMNLVVLMDRVDGYSDEPVGEFGNFSGTRAFQVTPTGLVDLGVASDASMVDPAMLQGFVGQVLSALPAEHHALVLWDHAGAWRGFAVDSTDRSNNLSADEVAGAVGAALQTAGLERLDVIYYDACLMAELSVATALAPVADYLIASEEVVPAFGADYSALADATSGGAENFASVMTTAFQRSARAFGADLDITMSVIDLAALAALNAAVEELGAAMAAASPEEAAGFFRAATEAAAFAGGDEAYAVRDLGQILAR
ncbi:MAG: clostripain-related cysteine peptidase, partial [Actinomycetota bacterium]|nr:clostripain-related cysteine peptidase [Actinomycetota bacterium]